MAQQRYVYLSGRYVTENEARLSIFDSALMFGDAVFEMTRTYGQKPFRLMDHLERLYASMDYALIDCGMTIEEMEEATQGTIEKNRDALGDFDFQIMHNVSRGPLGLYAEILEEGAGPVVTISTIPLVRHVGSAVAMFEQGAHFVITPQQSVPSRYIDPKAKNRSRIYYSIANLQASRMAEGSQPLLTDERGCITEGTGSNFFMAKDGEVYTPKGHDILRGVSRAACMEYARGSGRSVHEADIQPFDVRAADEAWFTTTPFTMVPITRFDFAPVGDGVPGPIYAALVAAWSVDVGVDILAQVREYGELAKTWKP